MVKQNGRFYCKYETICVDGIQIMYIRLLQTLSTVLCVQINVILILRKNLLYVFYEGKETSMNRKREKGICYICKEGWKGKAKGKELRSGFTIKSDQVNKSNHSKKQ